MTLSLEKDIVRLLVVELFYWLNSGFYTVCTKRKFSSRSDRNYGAADTLLLKKILSFLTYAILKIDSSHRNYLFGL